MVSRQETKLSKILKDKIREQGPLTFQEFMSAALYDPLHGFYTRGPCVGDRRGPFNTSAMFPPFAFALAQSILAADTLLGMPLRIVEVGGGTGMLGRQILAHLPGPREYVVIETSPELRHQQREQGLQVVASAEELSPAPSFLFGNEVLDALPIHRLMGEGEGKLCEMYVALDKTQELVEWFSDLSTPALADRLVSEGIVVGGGQIIEICLEYEAFLQNLSKTVSTGYLTFIDYGEEAQVLYHFTKRNGTLRMYRDQQQMYDPFDGIGFQDLTADVDFTAVITLCKQLGWEYAGRRPQATWLSHIGINEYLTVASNVTEAQEEITQLTHLAKLGSTFDVLAFKTPGLPPSPGFS